MDWPLQTVALIIRSCFVELLDQCMPLLFPLKLEVSLSFVTSTSSFVSPEFLTICYPGVPSSFWESRGAIPLGWWRL